jgi:hypothetical protein
VKGTKTQTSKKEGRKSKNPDTRESRRKQVLGGRRGRKVQNVL